MPVPLRVLSGAEVEAAVGMEEAIAAMREAFGALADGRAHAPLRTALPAPGGTTLVMPARLDGEGLGAKVVSVFANNRGRGLPTIHAIVLALDPATGAPLAVMDGTRLTARRTAAASALATDLLAEPEADVLALFGAGAQARAHVPAIRAVRRIRAVRIVSRTRESAERLAAELRRTAPELEVRALEDRREALRGAGIVVAATSSRTPVFDGRDVEDGACVCSIGAYTPEMREVDETTVRRARVVVDTRDAALAEAGDLIAALRSGAIGEEHLEAELGAIVNGTAPRGRAGCEIALFKSTGNAAQDVAMAARVLRAAQERGLGRVVEI